MELEDTTFDEVEMYRVLIDAKCRDHHGWLLMPKVNAYINKNCRHFPLEIQSSLSHHQKYNRLYDNTLKRREAC